MPPDDPTFDLLIIGGGINGAGIARDAAGRGLSVVLCERGDLACATSSASSKLIHGGLRYLEQYEFRLVAEALAEREVLLRIAPHIIHPLTFVLPRVEGMRPGWMLRAGLWLYDHIGGRTTLPRSRGVKLAPTGYGSLLAPELRRGYAYSDCWVDDARLVVLNCRAAADLGARIHVRTEVLSAHRESGAWHVQIRQANRTTVLRARVLVNAAGPWTRSLLGTLTDSPVTHDIRLVKGSHIVTRRLYEGDHAYILQNHDRRVVLVIPYLDHYTLIGTTDVPQAGDASGAVISHQEIAYLCDAVNRYSRRPIGAADVYWSFSGVRPLYDDGSANPSEVTRDYKLLVDEKAGLPLLSIYGGKVTTYRRLAEHALDELKPWLPRATGPWTAGRALPGGDLAGQTFEAWYADLAARHPDLPAAHLRGLAVRHGSRVDTLFDGAPAPQALGRHLGAGLYEREVDHLIRTEWARSAEDILWRRTKAGLGMTDDEQADLARYVERRVTHLAAGP